MARRVRAMVTDMARRVRAMVTDPEKRRPQRVLSERRIGETRNYSYRKATIGSTRAAFLAGR